MLVPALVGLPAAQAHEVAMAARVVAIDPDPDTPPTVEGTVTAQQPEAGTRVPAGEAVTIWVEPDSGGGRGRRQHAADPAGQAARRRRRELARAPEKR